MPDGTVGYTRDGSFQVDANGQLVTNSGYVGAARHHDPGQRAERDHRRRRHRHRVAAGPDRAADIGQLQIASFVNPAGLDPQGSNLFAETAASGTPNTGSPQSNGLGTLQQGYVETSNVNVVEELVSMIQTQRAYEMNSKAIQTTDQMLQKLAQL